MADEGNQGLPPNEAPEGAAPEQGQPDPIQNVKAEMNRKLASMNDTIAQQNKLMEQVIEQLTQRQPQQQAAPAKPLKDLVFEDPEQLVNIISERATKAANQAVEQRVQISTQSQMVINDMQSRYPEFAQANSEAASLAIQKAGQQSPSLRGTPEGVRLAMMDAVAELGLVPASKRQPVARQEADDFSNSGSTQGSSRRAAADPKKGLDPATLAMAEALGRDINDPKVIEGLVKASKRPNWNRYS